MQSSGEAISRHMRAEHYARRCTLNLAVKRCCEKHMCVGWIPALPSGMDGSGESVWIEHQMRRDNNFNGMPTGLLRTNKRDQSISGMRHTHITHRVHSVTTTAHEDAAWLGTLVNRICRLHIGHGLSGQLGSTAERAV